MSNERYQSVLECPTAYAPGDPVRCAEDDTLGQIEFCRTDGWCCIRWQTGSREWVRAEVLALWRGAWWDITYP
jgi:hypothetical protein